MSSAPLAADPQTLDDPLVASFVPGFHVTSFGAAFWGALVLAILNMFLRWLVFPRREREFERYR